MKHLHDHYRPAHGRFTRAVNAGLKRTPPERRDTQESTKKRACSESIEYPSQHRVSMRGHKASGRQACGQAQGKARTTSARSRGHAF